MVEVRRGQIWWVESGDPLGSEPGFLRPAVVVQSNAFNASAINTILVAPLTKTLRLADAPGNVRVSKRRSGLKHDSVINLSQVAAISRSRLREYHGDISTDILGLLNAGLRKVFAL